MNPVHIRSQSFFPFFSQAAERNSHKTSMAAAPPRHSLPKMVYMRSKLNLTIQIPAVDLSAVKRT